MAHLPSAVSTRNRFSPLQEEEAAGGEAMEVEQESQAGPSVADPVIVEAGPSGDTGTQEISQEGLSSGRPARSPPPDSDADSE